MPVAARVWPSPRLPERGRGRDPRGAGKVIDALDTVVGCDVGGTFTDLILLQPGRGGLRIFGWIRRNRRLWTDPEAALASAQALLYAAAMILVPRRGRTS